MTRLSADEDGLLTDIGAIDNLGGDKTMRRIDAAARKHGHAAMQHRAMDRPMTVEGVGNGAQSAREVWSVTVCTADHQISRYEAPILENSELPCLWGLRSISEKRGLIDTYNKRIYLVGEGGYQLKASPGTTHFDLETAPSGHLMLPVTCYNRMQDAEVGGQEKTPVFALQPPVAAWAPVDTNHY